MRRSIASPFRTLVVAGLLSICLPLSANIVLLDNVGFVYAHANGGEDFRLSPPASATVLANSTSSTPATSTTTYETVTSGFDFTFIADALAIAGLADPLGDPSYSNTILSLWFTIVAPVDTFLDYTLTVSGANCAGGGSAAFSVSSGLMTSDWSACEAGERTGRFLVTPGGQALSVYLNLAALDFGVAESRAQARYHLTLSQAPNQPRSGDLVSGTATHLPEPGTWSLVAVVTLAGLAISFRRRASTAKTPIAL